MMLSLSSSGSQASPCPSLSRSSCPEFGIIGQLSCSQTQLSLTESRPIGSHLRCILFVFVPRLFVFVPFGSERWHSACRAILRRAIHPDQSHHHTGSHHQRTRQHRHTCTRSQTPGQGIYTQHTCGRCECCLCKDCTVHTPTTIKLLWGSKSHHGLWMLFTAKKVCWKCLFKEENTCLPGIQGLLHSQAVRLVAFVAGRTRQTVESRVCVYALWNTNTLHFTLKMEVQHIKHEQN